MTRYTIESRPIDRDTVSHYECIGPVRGSCGIRHRGPDAAQRCCERDMGACHKQGGYSDRSVTRVLKDGTRQTVFFDEDDYPLPSDR
jgi:hypothetical protein